jgi:hypothetical protein
MQETVEEYRKRMFGYLEAHGGDPMELQADAPRRLERLLKDPSRIGSAQASRAG